MIDVAEHGEAAVGVGAKAGTGGDLGRGNAGGVQAAIDIGELPESAAHESGGDEKSGCERQFSGD